MKKIGSQIHAVTVLISVAAIVLTGSISHATGSSLQLFNTGVSGGLLADGTLDPHYSLVSAPSPYTMATTGAGSLPTPWLADGPNSRWIGASTWLAEWLPVGTYVYRTTFDLTGFIPSSATINLSLAADNVCSVRLNGVPTGITTPPDAFTSFSAFSINSGFVSGVNTLDFYVENTVDPFVNATPTGLRVEMSGYATVVPEPTTVALAGVATMLIVARRKNT